MIRVATTIVTIESEGEEEGSPKTVAPRARLTPTKSRPNLQKAPTTTKIQRGVDIRKSKTEEALGAKVYAGVVRYYRDNQIVQGRCKLSSKLILEQLIQLVGGKHNLKSCKMVEEAIFFESFAWLSISRCKSEFFLSIVIGVISTIFLPTDLNYIR